MCLIFVGEGYPPKYFNVENFFPNYGSLYCTACMVKPEVFHVLANIFVHTTHSQVFLC